MPLKDISTRVLESVAFADILAQRTRVNAPSIGGTGVERGAAK